MSIITVLRRTVCAFLLAGSALAQQLPSIAFESLLDTPFHPSGVLAFDNLDVVFAPPPPVQGRIDVVKIKGGETIASFNSLPDYRMADKAFARMAFVGPAHAQLNEPGAYEVRVFINGTLATAMPFTARVSGADDPFNPDKTWAYEGPWSKWGYFTMRPLRDTEVIDLVYWTGKEDLAPGTTKDALQAKLLRGGKVIAHSSGYKGHIANERFRRHDLTLYEPHEAAKEPNPVPLSIANLMEPGKYELRLERGSDNKVLRTFRFSTKDGRIVPHSRTDLKHNPATEFIAPRVLKKGTSSYEFVAVEWLESR
ncbi:MAG: hypothetical protein WC997_17110 [Porticoccaceae bacterium]